MHQKEKMTGRQRVSRAIRHEPVDRIPIDLGAHFSTGISAVAYWNLREYLGFSTDSIEMIDCVQGLARVDDDILDRFHVDTILLNPPWSRPHKWTMREPFRFLVPDTFNPVQDEGGGWTVKLGKDNLYMPAGGFFFDGTWPDFYKWKSKEEKLKHFGQRAREIYENTDQFTLFMGFGAYFDGIDFACDMLTDPEICHEKNEKSLGENITYFDDVNRNFGNYIGAIEVNSDLGIQDAPMCSPDSYAEICLPYLKRFCSHVHENSDIKIFLHSCGAIEPLIPLLIEAGVDILNPVQISAAGMDAKTLKEKYGRHIAFWGGGCNTQEMLWKASPAQIQSHVKELVRIWTPGSGYVFNQVHNIMGDVPPENIVAMYDAAFSNAAESNTIS